MKTKKLSFREFINSFKLIPRLAVDLIVENKKGEILLSKREMEPYLGYWHIPGSFLLKNESLINCVKRVARVELGLNIQKAVFITVDENIKFDPRGHIVDLYYRCVTDSQVTKSNLTFFKTLPKKIGFNQKKILKIK